MEISVTSVLYHSNPWIPLQIQDWKEISELDFEKGDSAYILSLLKILKYIYMKEEC